MILEEHKILMINFVVFCCNTTRLSPFFVEFTHPITSTKLHSRKKSSQQSYDLIFEISMEPAFILVR